MKKHAFSINPVAPQRRRVPTLASLLLGALPLAACGGTDAPTAE